jgi:PTH1 family peptidyl-tRNA hydrolase
MMLIVGLGNPGKEYADTRHNMGWLAVDEMARAHGFGAWQKKFKGLAAAGRVAGEPAVLLKPHTYMNLSGESVRAAAAFYKVAPADVLVVQDEIDLPFLHLKYKVGGGDAGHNGLKSITRELGTPAYRRLRIGIGRPPHKSQVADYVLAPFNAAEALDVSRLCTDIAERLPELLREPAKALALMKTPV